MRVTRAAREGIFSLRLGSGGSFPIRRPLSAAAALSVRILLKTVFSVKAFDKIGFYHPYSALSRAD